MPTLLDSIAKPGLDTQATSREIPRESGNTPQDHGRRRQKSVCTVGQFGRDADLALYETGRSSNRRQPSALSTGHDAPGKKDLSLTGVPRNGTAAPLTLRLRSAPHSPHEKSTIPIRLGKDQAGRPGLGIMHAPLDNVASPLEPHILSERAGEYRGLGGVSVLVVSAPEMQANGRA